MMTRSNSNAQQTCVDLSQQRRPEHFQGRSGHHDIRVLQLRQGLHASKQTTSRRAPKSSIFGGAASVARTVAENILVENNVLTRPLSWRTSRIVNHQVKNLFELKEGLHVVVRGNVMFNNWRRRSRGPRSWVTPRDEVKYLQDILFEDNVVYNTAR